MEKEKEKEKNNYSRRKGLKVIYNPWEAEADENKYVEFDVQKSPQLLSYSCVALCSSMLLRL